jgi:hypothetical protein
MTASSRIFGEVSAPSHGRRRRKRHWWSSSKSWTKKSTHKSCDD